MGNGRWGLGVGNLLRGAEVLQERSGVGLAKVAEGVEADLHKSLGGVGALCCLHTSSFMSDISTSRPSADSQSCKPETRDPRPGTRDPRPGTLVRA
jgi:hypothetical protein